MKHFIFLVSCLMLVGCSRQHPSAVGLRDLDEARQVADDFMLRASTMRYAQSSDTCKLAEGD